MKDTTIYINDNPEFCRNYHEFKHIVYKHLGNDAARIVDELIKRQDEMAHRVDLDFDRLESSFAETTDALKSIRANISRQIDLLAEPFPSKVKVQDLSWSLWRQINDILRGAVGCKTIDK